MNIVDAIDHDDLFAPWFPDRDGWRAWRAFLKALFGLPLSNTERKIYAECTGRNRAPREPLSEAWLVCGRRSGKSFILALVAVFLALFKDWSAVLKPGERGTILIIASDRKQGRVIMGYIKGLISGVPALAPKIINDKEELLGLDNGISIEIHTASFRSVRGYTIVAALCDEIAFWKSDDSANPDKEILDALRPGMATTLAHGALLLCASSPYAKRGALYEAYREHFRVDGNPVLVWQAHTRRMNPTVPQSVIDKAFADDAASAVAEYGAEFRSDVETYVPREIVEAVTANRRYSLPRVEGISYVAFTDPAGGSGEDSFTLGIAHLENGRAVLDLLRETAPRFSPEGVVKDYAATCKEYGVGEVTGDRWAGQWPREAFEKHGINYRLSDKSKSELYLEFLPLLNSGACEMLDRKKLMAQLCSLERKTHRGGKDTIDHPRHRQDDVANAAAGALLLAKQALPVEMWVLGDRPLSSDEMDPHEFVEAYYARR